MRRIALAVRGEDDATVTLGARIDFPGGPVRLTYATRTGALLRVAGASAGAFDRRHTTIELAPGSGERDVELVVERRSLPTDALPAGPGLLWRWYLARAAQRAARTLNVEAGSVTASGRDPGVPLTAHAHLDVAWLWTYSEARRKARRTFATALRLAERDASFVYAQSQPQLYAWLAQDDPALLDRVKSTPGWDASVAALWVEPDLHAPSGESVLRHFAQATWFMRERFGVEPSVAWLPDTFGFPSTLPTLALHAGVSFFATTKLEWNETTRWPYPQFVWYGPDGSRLLSAVIASYDGDLDERRIATARTRREPLIVGYGDGGGGATDEQVARARTEPSRWTSLDAFFRTLAENAALPAYRGELYLETHRGTYTTRRSLKAGNAALERLLAEAEEAAAWCVAVRAPATVVGALRDDLQTAWRLLLRNQFHDVMAGTSIAPVYDDVAAEYARVDAIAARVLASASSVLPRAHVQTTDAPEIAPQEDDGGWSFANAYVRAHVRRDGIVDALAGVGGRNVVTMANALTLFRDRPKRYDAWNLDAGYDRRPLRVRPQDAARDGDGLQIRYRIGRRSTATLRVSLRDGEPWLRMALAVDWNEDHAILRVEHRIALRATEVLYGQPHGALARPLGDTTPAGRAKFEVPAQRWAHVSDDDDGVAVLVPDLYGWNAVGLRRGGVRLGTSLLRAPRWPDPACDRGQHAFTWALAPTAGATPSGLETAWSAFAERDRVRVFTSDASNVRIVATYPGRDAGTIVVRVRECDGLRTRLRLRCGGRMREAVEVDAAERPVAREPIAIEEETVVTDVGPFALRAFLVRF